MRASNNGKTVGITLRIEVRVLDAYRKIASRANLIEIRKGRQGGVTAQDVMRHRLSSLPVLKQLANEIADEKD